MTGLCQSVTAAGCYSGRSLQLASYTLPVWASAVDTVSLYFEACKPKIAVTRLELRCPGFKFQFENRDRFLHDCFSPSNRTLGRHPNAPFQVLSSSSVVHQTAPYTAFRLCHDQVVAAQV
jgi:hypothetical protein